jgi:hypothetical protein
MPDSVLARADAIETVEREESADGVVIEDDDFSSAGRSRMRRGPEGADRSRVVRSPFPP